MQRFPKSLCEARHRPPINQGKQAWVPYRLRPSVKESPKADKPLPSIADKAVIGRHGSSDQGILVVLLSGRTHCFIPLNSWESSHLPATCGNWRKDSARGIKNHVFPTLEKYWLRSSVPSVLWHIYRLNSTPSPPPPFYDLCVAILSFKTINYTLPSVGGLGTREEHVSSTNVSPGTGEWWCSKAKK